MKAEIITIGDEILIGQVVDTNSAWMAEQLNLAGIEVVQITSVHDHYGQIVGSLGDASCRADLVLITGGLGPTRDDITKASVCEFFNTSLVFHQPTFDHIQMRFAKRGIDLNRLNRDQAMLPADCTILPNAEGTAPGMWFESGDTIFVFMPGVPFEMKGIFTGEVLPRLFGKGEMRAIIHRTVLTQGVPESMLALRLEQFENALPPHIKLAYLPGPMAVRLRLSAAGDDVQQLIAEINRQVEFLQILLPEEIYGFDNDTLAQAAGRLLSERKATLAVAESCTGGYISHLLTLIPGASEWYSGGITAYDNTVKMNLLGVRPDTLRKFGAVSEQTVIEMVQGMRRLMQTQYAMATTGIAGPGGGTGEKPVGTIWIAVEGPAKLIVKKYVFGNNRERNIMRSSQTALQLLRQLLVSEL